MSCLPLEVHGALVRSVSHVFGVFVYSRKRLLGLVGRVAFLAPESGLNTLLLV